MTKRMFNKLYKNKAVHCPTKELAKEFIDLAYSVGYTWAIDTYIESNNDRELWYSKYENNTCYIIGELYEHIQFGSKRHFKNNHYTIIVFRGLEK